MKLRETTGLTGGTQTGRGTGLMKTEADGTLSAQGLSDTYNINQWNDIEVVYERSGGQVELSYSVNGRNIGTTTRSTVSYEDDLSYLTFTSGEYELYVDDVSVQQVQQNDRFEPNNDFSSATSLTPGAYSNLQIVSGESDFFAVDLDQGDEITASIQFDHSEGDLDLALYDPNRNGIEDSVSVSDDEQVSTTAQQSGTYYIEAYGFSGASAPYSLDLSAGGNDDLDVRLTQIDPGSFPTIETFVSVTDNSGNPITGLSRSNFDMSEEGTSTSINSFDRVGGGSGVDISTALVLDRSGSMKPDDEPDLVDAANTFVSQFEPGDEAEIINFANVIRTEQRWTSDTSQLENAIDQSVSDDGNTKLYDSIAQGVRDAELRRGRSAVIAMTDGQNTDSATNIDDPQQVIDIAQQNNVPVYTIGLGVSSTSVSSLNKTETNEETDEGEGGISPASRSELRDIARQTGGQYFETPDSSDLSQIYQDISQSISNEYRLTYSTPNRREDGTDRQVRVEVQSSGDAGSDTGIYTAPDSVPPSIPKSQVRQDFDVNGQTVTFDASAASDPDGTIDEYRWDFTNDGQVDATGEVVTHTYSSSGTIECKLIVVDNSGTVSQEVFDILVGGGDRIDNIQTTLSDTDGDNLDDQVQVDVTVSDASRTTIELDESNFDVDVSATDDSQGALFQELDPDGDGTPEGVQIDELQVPSSTTYTVVADLSGQSDSDTGTVDVSIDNGAVTDFATYTVEESTGPLSPNNPFGDASNEPLGIGDAADVLFEWNQNGGVVDGVNIPLSDMADFLFGWNQARS